MEGKSYRKLTEAEKSPFCRPRGVRRRVGSRSKWRTGFGPNSFVQYISAEACGWEATVRNVARRRGAPFRGLPGRVARLYGRRRRADLNVGRYVANYDIGDRAVIENVGEMICDGATAFGNGVEVAVNAGGRARSADIRRTDGADRLCDRDVPSPSADGAADDAMIAGYAERRVSRRGTIGADSRIVNTLCRCST